MSGCYSFEEEEFEDISKEAKNFISKMLILEQSKRMHAAAALYHPWMLGQKVRIFSLSHVGSHVKLITFIYMYYI